MKSTKNKVFKLAIVVSHPIQYYSPLFRILAKKMNLKVFYGFNPDAGQQGKEGFGRAFNWDIDLLSGYDYEFVGNVAKVPSTNRYLGCDTPMLKRSLKDYGATHVVSFGWNLKMYRQALKYCKSNKVTIAVRGDSQLDPNLPIWKKVLKKLYYPFFLNQYDLFLSVGKRNMEYLEYYRVPQKKIIFSPHAINQSFWRVDDQTKKNKFTFLWVAKFVSKKRPLDAIRAFKKLIIDHPELSNKVELRMVGSGKLLKQSKSEAKGLRQIRFQGFKNQSELKSEYSSSNCLLLTSDYGETWGLVANEAFAATLPIIVSKACGCAPDLVDGISGLTYPLGDISSLSRKMKKMHDMMNNKETLTKVKQSIEAKNKIYSYSRITMSFEKLKEYART